MTTTLDPLLVCAADHGATCTIALPSEPVAVLRRSRILQVDDSGIWVSSNPADQSQVQRLIDDGHPIHVTIRSEDADLLFHAVPLSIHPTFITKDKRCVCALLLRTPDKLSTSQRRKTFRVPLSDVEGVTLRIWRLNEYVLLRDRVLPSQELRCVAKDLGEGGFGAVVYPKSDEPLNLKFNQRFRVEVKSDKHEMVFEARLRHPESTQRDDESADCGFEFIYNDRDVETRRHRQKLQLVLSEVQRNLFKRDSI